YFFARSLDSLRPGGLLIAITTHFTMDAAKRQRELLASKGELIGAIRLPNNAFKENAGTEVTTDIIILRKPTSSQIKGQAWQNTAEIATNEGDQATINEYFAAHPDMMLGTASMAGSMYARDEERTEFTLMPKPDQNLYEAIADTIEKLPLNVMGESTASTDTSEIDRIGEAKGLKEESLHLRDGQLVIVRDGKFEPAKTFYPKLGNAKVKMQAQSYITVRDHYQTLIKLMLDETATDETITAARNKLNKLYDEYVFRYNVLNENPTKIFSFDPGYWLVLSLEKKINATDTNTGDIRTEIVKADVFTKRTIEPRRPPLKCETVKDALRVSLCYRGQLDVPYIAQLTGKDRGQIEAELIENALAFENPETGLWETTETYLSGNVRKKLQEAERAAQSDSKYNRNVEKLAAIQPALIGIKDIHYKIGGTWIPADLVEQFVHDVLEVNGAEVRYVSKLDSWIVSGNSYSMANTETFGTSRLRAIEILDKILNLKRPEVYDKDSATGKRTLNQKETTAAQMAAEKIEKEFLKWIKTSDDRVLKLQEAYNEAFNWYIPPKFNGDHLELPGTSNAITLRPYQKDAVWRLLQQGYG
ncbi:MAG: hypothetical protein Q7T18_07190, partial [Sedimentisphaerales bacterium]|nr:hypothetical protein [Sedimentisphaerales bacterium]